MEFKNVGKVGMVKRKQFLQKRDISRSHEVIKMILLVPCAIKSSFLRKQKEKGAVVLQCLTLNFLFSYYMHFVFPLHIII
jgi:hypothetical protein